VESIAGESLKEENEAMPVVRVLLREGQEKLYYEANASRLLLDSRVVDLPMVYNLTFIILSSLKPLFFNQP
jgi:hypothetical protein